MHEASFAAPKAADADISDGSLAEESVHIDPTYIWGQKKQRTRNQRRNEEVEERKRRDERAKEHMKKRAY